MDNQNHGEEQPKTSNASQKRTAGRLKPRHVPTDITFLLGNTPFKGRKAVLAESSSVFQAMFFGPLANGQDIVEIKDMDTTGFRNLIQFIHTGKVVLKGIKDTLATAVAADRYNVPKLYDLCVQRVESAVSVVNIWAIYEAAILLENHVLRKVCKEFLIEHAAVLLRTDQFLLCPTLILTYLANDLPLDVSPYYLIPALIAWTRRRKILINFVFKTFKSHLYNLRVKPEDFQTYVDYHKSKVLTNEESTAIMWEIRERYRKRSKLRWPEL